MKKTLKAAMFAAVVVAAGFCGYKSYNAYTVNESTLMAENIEALSDPGEGNNRVIISCYSSIVYKAGASVVECSSCKEKENSTDAWYCLSSECVTYQ